MPCRSQWPNGLRRKSAAARLLSLVESHRGHGCLLWMFVMSGRGLCDELISRPEESYRLARRFVWSRYLVNEEVLANWGAIVPKERNVCHALFKNDNLTGLHRTAHLTCIREVFGLKICRGHAVLFCVVHKSWAPGLQNAVATKLRALACNICGSSIWNLLHGIFIWPRTWRWLLNFCKILHPCLFNADWGWAAVTALYSIPN
jgi:hypothetical protein